MEALVTELMAGERSYAGAVTPFDRSPGWRRVEWLLEVSEAGFLEMSLADLVVLGAFRDVRTARRAVADLEPADHVVSVDVARVHERTAFEIRWAPVTGIVNLMLDWDLATLEITIAELAAWLDVDQVVIQRALTRLGGLRGVEVTGLANEVRIVLEVDRCPLTSFLPFSAA